MKKLIIILFLGIFTNLLSQLKKEPVATPAPFDLKVNIDLSSVIQPLAKSLTVGDTTFYLRKDLNDGTAELESVEFYRLFENNEIVVFAECTEYDNGRVTDETVDNIVQALLYRTPQNSYNPDKGILTNLTDIFGNTPDVDGNEKLFVLLADARDGYEEGDSDTYIAGYFDPLDQIKSKGNYSDIIYIDTNPAQTTDEYTLGIVTHELQHLIHYNYDSNESTWLNEGFSELAPILLGYDAHSFSRFLSDTNRKLATFDGSIRDYSKVGLWSFYLYQRFGIDGIQAILRNTTNSTLSVEESLQNLGYDITFKNVLTDWFLANYLNNIDISGGKYSYHGAAIPLVNSEHFHSNFTENEVINDIIRPQAAQYIRFDSGNNINFQFDIQQHSLAKVIQIRHKDQPEITFPDISNGRYSLEDFQFGNDYDMISFIVLWTASVTESNDLEFSYAATGSGGFEEFELSHDADSLNYYIDIGTGSFAAEKFSVTEEAQLKALKFNGGNSNNVDLKIFTDLSSPPIKTIRNINSNYQEWTKYVLNTPIGLSENSDIFIAVGSANDNSASVGYSGAGSGKGLAYLDNGGGFRDLNSFTLNNGEVLEGNWLIRAIVIQQVEEASHLTLQPDTLVFSDGDTVKQLTLVNTGTEMINWSVSDIPDYLSISDTTGIIGPGKIALNIERNADNYLPGVYIHDLIFNSDKNSDTLHTIWINRNQDKPQTAFLLSTNNFQQQAISGKIFNIGTGNGIFEFNDLPNYLGVSPQSGIVYGKDTLSVTVMVDSALISKKQFSMSFFDGITHVSYTLRYDGSISPGTNGSLKLYGLAPNPFSLRNHGSGKIRVYLERDKKANLKLINIAGEVVKHFTFPDYSAGLHLLQWNGRNDQGKFVSSGVYFLNLTQGNDFKVKKILFIK